MVSLSSASRQNSFTEKSRGATGYETGKFDRTGSSQFGGRLIALAAGLLSISGGDSARSQGPEHLEETEPPGHLEQMELVDLIKRGRARRGAAEPALIATTRRSSSC